jgi:3D (Asp-Asp-Asp) domain-containing protein
VNGLASAALAAACVAATSCRQPAGIYRHEPVVVTSPIMIEGAVVRGAEKGWYRLASGPQYGEPVPVILTSYCLNGTTRRGRYVRPGIVAADPKYFPLSRYIELYIGRKYYGRFLVDDTGRKIRGPHLDVWLSSCKDAKRFGLKHGTAMLVRRSPVVRLAGSPK